MKIRLFSDPHLGVNRRANTTAASRVRLKQAALQAVNDLTDTEDKLICVGDFFDTYSNDEEDIISTCNPFSKLSFCLSGNHDVVNDNSKKGSLDVLAEVFPSVMVPRVAVGEVDTPFPYRFHEGRLLIQAIPHHSSQQLFEDSLQQAYDLAKKVSDKEVTKILLLHCNYNLPEALGTDTALNLTEEDAEVLFEVFDYVLLGHEHTPSEHFGGRLFIVGNTFPTSFSDISDKRYLTFDSDTKSMESHTIWEAGEGYVELEANNLTGSEFPALSESVKFVKVVGSVPMEHVKEVAKAIQNKLWKAYPDQLLAVKDATTVLREDSGLELQEEGSVISLPDLLNASLKDTPMYDLWRELLTEYQEDKDNHND